MIPSAAVARYALGTCALGRALDAYGRPLDDGPPLDGRRVVVPACAPLPSQRDPVEQALWSGVRAIDALLTVGRGARAGIFGAPGAGKSTLLESIVSGSSADAVVVALIGERGREAQRWISATNGHTTVICATSDRPADERIHAADLAFAHAAALRSRGLHVLLVLDSLARVAQALRERALAAGEASGRMGYPPGVFAEIARMVEIAGPAQGGSMTLIATVLDDGDSRDPVSDAARSLLDGHIQLSSARGRAGRYPAIDVPASASRTMNAVVSRGHSRAAAVVREALATLERLEDARALGIQPSGGPAAAALAAEAAMERLLRQGPKPASHRDALAALHEAADILEEHHGHYA